MPLLSSQQLRSPVRIHKRNSLILIREIHYRTHKFMVIHAPSFIVVHEAKVEDMVVEVLISLNVNSIGKWITLFSNVTIVLTHSLLVFTVIP